MEQRKRSRSESKYYHTACLMDQALIALLEMKQFEYITIREVCEKAGVNRSTFYLHYENMNDLLRECVEYVTERMKSKYLIEDRVDRKQITNCSAQELLLFSPKYLIPYLEFVRENKPLFSAVASQPLVFEVEQTFHRMYADIFEPITGRFHIPEWEKKYRVTFFIHGIHAMIMEWIKGGCAEETQQIAGLIQDCIHPKENRG